MIDAPLFWSQNLTVPLKVTSCVNKRNHSSHQMSELSFTCNTTFQHMVLVKFERFEQRACFDNAIYLIMWWETVSTRAVCEVNLDFYNIKKGQRVEDVSVNSLQDKSNHMKWSYCFSFFCRIFFSDIDIINMRLPTIYVSSFTTSNGFHSDTCSVFSFADDQIRCM